MIVTKVGARRGDHGSWIEASSAAELTSAVHDNLTRLGIDAIDVVNFRGWGSEGPVEGSIERHVTVLAELQRQGLIRHIGPSNVTAHQVAEGRSIADIVCVQNQYNLVHRGDDLARLEAVAEGEPD